MSVGDRKTKTVVGAAYKGSLQLVECVFLKGPPCKGGGRGGEEVNPHPVRQEYQEQYSFHQNLLKCTEMLTNMSLSCS